MKPSSETSLLLIDGNNIGYAAMYQPALSRLSFRDFPTGGILGLVQSILRLSSLFPDAVPVVLWDGHAAWRKVLCPEYKATRKDTPEKEEIAEKWRVQAPHAQTLLLHMGVAQARAADAEADDLAYRICRLENEQRGKVTLVSADKDWWQAISPDIDWFSPITDKRVTLADLLTDAVDDGPFRDTDEFILAKAIAGDKSDNIPGVSGVGVKTAVKLLVRHGSLEGIAAAVASGVAKDKKAADVAGSLDLIQRNLRIMDWRLAPVPQEVGMVREAFDASACGTFCEALGLHRLAERLDSSGEWSKRMSRLSMAGVLDWVDAALFPRSGSSHEEEGQDNG